MKRFLSIIFLFFSARLFCQEINQDINTIAVKGVTFNQVLTKLRNSGYAIDKLDDHTKTVSTRFSKYASRTASMNISINVHVRDRVAVITGRMCYNLNNRKDAPPDSSRSMEIRHTFGIYKEAFLQLNNFAKSFDAEIIYLKTD